MNTTETPKHQEAFTLATSGEYTPTIQFRFETDNVHALPYAYLMSIEFNKSGLITLDFTTHKVEIRGRRLDKLFASLVHYQVISVRQHSITDARPPMSECCVDRLVITANDS
jgi:hypothetical protein